MLTLSAALSSVPEEFYDSARVDGASFTQYFRHIVLPWIMPVVVLVLLFRTMFAIRTFDTIFGIWRGPGPLKAGSVLGTYLYEQFRVLWNVGQGAAISYILFGITIILCYYPAKKLYQTMRS
jgi:ABC-type sugar transport system permease subunit